MAHRLKTSALHHWAMNRGCGGLVSSFIIVCYGYGFRRGQLPVSVI